MSVPQRPMNCQLANIIDKLAEFVARNGPEFEQMTKIKQKNNLKFGFLKNGSEFFDYYQYRVMEERRNLIGKVDINIEITKFVVSQYFFSGMPHQPQNILQQQQQQSIWSSSAGTPQVQNVGNYSAQIEIINAEQMKLREQITQSEKNLQAQHQVGFSNLIKIWSYKFIQFYLDILKYIYVSLHRRLLNNYFCHFLASLITPKKYNSFIAKPTLKGLVATTKESD